MEHSPSPGRSFEIGFLLYPGVTLLDVAGPLEVLARLPGVRVRLIARHAGPIRCESGSELTADTLLDSDPSLDVLVVPGGPGIDTLLDDEPHVTFVRQAVDRGKIVASVCTGALLIGAAGALDGRRATTHWRYLDLLASFGAQAVAKRVVVDGNIITAAGVSAGIDMALSLAARLAGEEEAARIALIIEYDPAPPVRGSESASSPAIVASVRAETIARYESRRAAVVRAAANARPIEMES